MHDPQCIPIPPIKYKYIVSKNVFCGYEWTRTTPPGWMPGALSNWAYISIFWVSLQVISYPFPLTPYGSYLHNLFFFADEYLDNARFSADIRPIWGYERIRTSTPSSRAVQPNFRLILGIPFYQYWLYRFVYISKNYKSPTHTISTYSSPVIW